MSASFHAVSWCATAPPGLPTDAAVVSNQRATVGLRHCMQFLDSHSAWEVETTDFGQDGRGPSTAHGNASIQIMRLREDYVAEDGQKAPFMRLVGFFPGATSTSVFHHLTDLTLRQKWDTNYRAFERFEGNDTPSRHMKELSRPLFSAVRTARQCEGDVCRLVPDTRADIIDSGFFFHRVGSRLLERLGVTDRFFAYERVSWEYSSVAPIIAPVRMYDVLYHGVCPTTGEQGPLAAAQQWWMHNEKRKPAVPVAVHYQHILLLPIANFDQQVTNRPGAFSEITRLGSMADTSSTETAYRIFRESVKLAANGETGLEGTLLVMTSANEAGVPKQLPRFAQKKIASVVGHQAYGELMKALRRDATGAK